MKKHNYNVRWAQAGKPAIANVSIMATTDDNAKRAADKIARELGVMNTPRTMTKDGQLIETLTKGVR